MRMIRLSLWPCFQYWVIPQIYWIFSSCCLARLDFGFPVLFLPDLGKLSLSSQSVFQSHTKHLMNAIKVIQLSDNSPWHDQNPLLITMFPYIYNTCHFFFQTFGCIPLNMYFQGLKVGGEGDNRGWDGWMASPTQWTWVWVVLWVGDGEGSLAYCSPWGSQSQTWTELNWTGSLNK